MQHRRWRQRVLGIESLALSTQIDPAEHLPQKDSRLARGAGVAVESLGELLSVQVRGRRQQMRDALRFARAPGR
ncbi:MAG: hypothetical protein ACREUT_06435 [Steroidobacteraceae bacterium]